MRGGLRSGFRGAELSRMEFLEAAITAMFAGTAGVWYDGRADYVRQDSAGTTHVSASGDMVGRMIDRSGNGHHCSQTDNSKRSAWAGDGSINLRGTNSISPRFYESVSSVNLTGCAAVTVIVAARQVTTSSTRVLIGHGTLATGWIEVGLNASAGKSYAAGGVTGSWIYNLGSAGAAKKPWVLSVVFNPAGASHDARISIREHGVPADETQSGSGTLTSGAFGNATLCVGANTPTFENGGNFDFYGALVLGRALTSEELAICEEWASLRCPNASTAGTLTWADSGPLVSVSGTYNRTSQFASAQYNTSATAVQVGFQDETGGSVAPEYDIGVFSNGTLVRLLRGALAGDNTEFVTLPAGEKTVRIVNSAQGWSTYPSNEASGQFVKSVTFNAAATLANAVPSNRLLIYGDSLTSGGNADSPQTEAWVNIVRAARLPDSTAVEGWGWRRLYDDASDSTKRAAFITRVSAYGPAIFMMCIGSNDYGLTGWGHAAFGAAYAAVLDDFHAANPSATVIAVSPHTRAVETPNAHGSTTGQYRAAIAAACTGRAWATYVDGSSLTNLSHLASDGLHFTTAGHAAYAAGIKATLGIL